MIDPECRQVKIAERCRVFRPDLRKLRKIRETDLLLRVGKFMEYNFKRKFRCDDAERIHHAGKTFRPDEKQGRLTLCIAHREKKPRQAADVIRVKMREADDINRLRTPALLLHRDLRAFARIDQNTHSIVTDHERCQPPIRQRHHSSGPKEACFKHVNFPYRQNAATG